jgi:hypothetical protein
MTSFGELFWGQFVWCSTLCDAIKDAERELVKKSDRLEGANLQVNCSTNFSLSQRIDKLKLVGHQIPSDFRQIS